MKARKYRAKPTNSRKLILQETCEDKRASMESLTNAEWDHEGRRFSEQEVEKLTL